MEHIYHSPAGYFVCGMMGRFGYDLSKGGYNEKIILTNGVNSILGM